MNKKATLYFLGVIECSDVQRNPLCDNSLLNQSFGQFLGVLEEVFSLVLIQTEFYKSNQELFPKKRGYSRPMNALTIFE